MNYNPRGICEKCLSKLLKEKKVIRAVIIRSKETKPCGFCSKSSPYVALLLEYEER